MNNAMPLLALTLLLAIHITACDYWSPTQPPTRPSESSYSSRRSQRIFLDEGTRFNENSHFTIALRNWPASTVDAIYFLPINEATGFGHIDHSEERTYVFVRPAAGSAVLCRDDGQAIDGFQPNPAFAEVCIVDGQITLRKKQGYSFKDNPASLRIVSTTNVRTYQGSDFDILLRTGVLVANDTSWFDEKGYLRNKLVDWPASAVDVIYLELLNETTDYGHRDDLEQRIYIFRRTYQGSDFDILLRTGVLVANDTSWFDEKGYLRNKLVVRDLIHFQRIYIFRRPSETSSAVLCRDDGQAIDGFQPNPAFAEVCIADGRITLRKKQGYSFKDNPAFLWVVPVPETPR